MTPVWSECPFHIAISSSAPLLPLRNVWPEQSQRILKRAGSSEGRCSPTVPRDSLPRGGCHSEGSCSYLPVYFLIFSVIQASDVGKEFWECFQDFATQVGGELSGRKEKEKGRVPGPGIRATCRKPLSPTQTGCTFRMPGLVCNQAAAHSFPWIQTLTAL